MLENVVDVEAVFATKVDQFVPPSVDLSISYPVMAEPPLFDGAVQERLICDGEAVVAVRFVGGLGTSWALAGIASMPNDDNKRKTKIPVSKFL